MRFFFLQKWGRALFIGEKGKCVWVGYRPDYSYSSLTKGLFDTTVFEYHGTGRNRQRTPTYLLIIRRYVCARPFFQKWHRALFIGEKGKCVWVGYRPDYSYSSLTKGLFDTTIFEYHGTGRNRQRTPTYLLIIRRYVYARPFSRNDIVHYLLERRASVCG
jgi:hypothetical protein